MVARAEEVLLEAEFPWETCATTGEGYACQQPLVVFAVGLRPLGGDEFLVIYGGADTDVGAARISVSYNSTRAK